ncbi:glycosyltransferase [Phycisphaerales bacterium AB-hyl4]|uniref:Glycosyltransferase n=1 Tax=Natronomicrosphaera hydrolytica TaxID=3242702 RepID=A0ABV4UAF9_9BACT
MQFVFFYHSLISDWNHGNAHFLRGIVSELLSRGHDVRVFEPRDGWSLSNLLAEHGSRPVEVFEQAYRHLRSEMYDLATLDLDSALAGADVVIAHEWNHPDLIAALDEHRACHRHYRLLFHDTHHRSVSDPRAMAYYRLRHFDGVLAFGQVVAKIYREQGWAERVWVWHEAADTRVFYPRVDRPSEGELVWIGNWGDGERSEALKTFLLEPVKRLGLRAKVFGVRYPPEALSALAEAGVTYGGWLPNFLVPEVFARYRVTVHVPRRYYAEHLPGIPTIRPFEAMACAMPLVSAPWSDTEALFEAGRDYLAASDADEMTEHLRSLLADERRTKAVGEHGRQTIQRAHTCTHRVNELLDICCELELPVPQHDRVRRRPMPRTRGRSAELGEFL